MAELRNIAPSTYAEASSSSSLKQTSTPNTSGTSSATGNLNDSSPGDSGQRRRKHTGQVSALACVNCRRARARVSVTEGLEAPNAAKPSFPTYNILCLLQIVLPYA
jgi:hypothetical protein